MDPSQRDPVEGSREVIEQELSKAERKDKKRESDKARPKAPSPQRRRER